MSNEQKNISKLISYWLRHNPSDANLELDEFGYVSLTFIIDALSKKGFRIDKEQLIDLNSSFDKVRWKIDFQKNLIKATHGHSIPVILEEKPEIPPATLYHGTSNKYLKGIIENGLISKERQFVHLSENVDLAREIGKRHGRPFVLEVNTVDLIVKGWKFYKTEQDIWLTSNIPTDYLEFEPWNLFPNKSESSDLINELLREVNSEHVLYGILKRLTLRGSHYPSDDCLFEDIQTGKYYVVHPTWSGKMENLPWPNTYEYESLDKWINERLLDEQLDYY